jgi:gamma-glutamylcyclotransferase (GGCT)/AIG2-like uncharacterized protein YtfP
MSQECTRLFVYGTLRRDSGHPMAQFLSRQGRFLGPARVAGRLYDLGRYPGLVGAAAPDDWVFGDLYELTEGAQTLAALDRYEDYDPADPSSSLFERCLVKARLAAGEVLTAWAYQFRRPVSEEKRIHSGDYLAARKQG